MGLVSLETSGKSSMEKVNRTIRRMTVNNKLLPFIQEHPQDFLSDIHRGNNRGAIFTAIMCASYPVIYDFVTLCGRYFHAQDEVQSSLIFSKLSEKYGSNVDSIKGFNCTCRMLLEAGFITRPRTGYYAINRVSNLTDFADSIYKKAFLLNNPNYSETDDVSSHPFFEFIK